jgi:hypothetical protein
VENKLDIMLIDTYTKHLDKNEPISWEQLKEKVNGAEFASKRTMEKITLVCEYMNYDKLAIHYRDFIKILEDYGLCKIIYCLKVIHGD